jgi:phage terminase large subunit-like protein
LTTARRKPGQSRGGTDYQSQHAAVVQSYMDGVLSGEIVAGRRVIAAVKRQLRDLARSRKGWEYQFDWAAADRVINFIQCLKHTTGEFCGENFLLQPWQKFLIATLFGWRHKKTGLRRFRRAFITIGRGNGKSPIGAAMLLYLLCADLPPEPRAEIKIAATERGRKTANSGAMIVFNECERFIRHSPALSRACSILTEAIVFNKTEGAINPLGKEAKTKDGFNLHAYLADELHEWREEHQGTWDKLETAMGKRRQPLGIVITTAGSDRSKLWKRKHAEATKVIKRVYEDDELFVFLAEIDVAEDGLPGDDPFDSDAETKVWPKANPNLGISVKPEYLRSLTNKAKHDADEKQNLLRYHLNIVVRSRQKIVNLDDWQACGVEPLPELYRLVCHGGIDLGWRDDLASLYLVFPLPNRRFASLGWNWCCEETSHRNLDAEPWASLIKAGKLIVTPGEVFDPVAIIEKVRWCQKRFRLQTVALDQNNARSVEVELVNSMGLKVYSFGQNAKKYNEPIKSMLEASHERRLLTGADPLLYWAMSNMVVRRDVAGLMMPDKQYSEDKIDAACAYLMAYSECLYAGGAPAPTYNERGLRRLTQHAA